MGQFLGFLGVLPLLKAAREHTFTDYQKPVSKTYWGDILWYLTSSSTSEATFSPVRIAKLFHLYHFRALK